MLLVVAALAMGVGAEQYVGETIGSLHINHRASLRIARQEQAAGIGQVAEALAHLDRVTQQNAALVQQMAAAAASL